MGGVERRNLMTATAAAGVALSIGGAQSLLAPNEAHAQGTSLSILGVGRTDACSIYSGSTIPSSRPPWGEVT